MTDKRIVIVDDSNFSIAIIRNILEDHGFEVVGEAGTLEEVREVVKEKNPSLVTMDMTLPNTDGFECTRVVHEINRDIKVIMVSSMMDDEIVEEAKKNKISGYVQKPVDPDELITTIRRVMDSEELYDLLEEQYSSVFKEALLDGVNMMTKTLLTYKDEYCGQKEFKSKGITIVVGIIGKFSGRMLIDLSQDTADKLVTTILRKEPKNNDEVVSALAEIANIISGNACSILNRKSKPLGLRVAPPSVLSGDNVTVSPSDFNTTTVLAETDFGEILINVGFERSEERWM